MFVIRNDSASDDERTEALQALMGHAALFLLVSVVAAGVDLVDGAKGDTVLGLDWAFWFLIPWTVIFTIHMIKFLSRTSDGPPSEPPSTLIDNEADATPRRIRHLLSN